MAEVYVLQMWSSVRGMEMMCNGMGVTKLVWNEDPLKSPLLDFSGLILSSNKNLLCELHGPFCAYSATT